MKTIVLCAALALTFTANAQSRKTRSDKGGTHKHSASYTVKKAASSASHSSKSSSDQPKTTRRKK